MDFLEILQSWYRSVKSTEEQKKIAEQRLQVCDQCPAISRNPILRCRVCGCPLKAKVFSPKQDACPQHRWPKPEEQEQKISKLI